MLLDESQKNVMQLLDQLGIGTEKVQTSHMNVIKPILRLLINLAKTNILLFLRISTNPDETARSGRQVDLPWFPGLAPRHPEHGGAVILHDTTARITGNAAPLVANAHAESGTMRTMKFLSYPMLV